MVTRETRNLLNPDQRDALLLIFSNHETCEGPPCYALLSRSRHFGSETKLARHKQCTFAFVSA